MALNLDIEVFLDLVNQSARSVATDFDVNTMRNNYNDTTLVLDDLIETTTDDISIETRDKHTINIRRFGSHLETEKIILFFHGGGYVLGNLDTHQTLCARLCNELKCQVYSVDYRLAPEYKFPTAFEDACDAYKWLIDKIDCTMKKVIVAGDSVGATLATNICVEAKKQNWKMPTKQILLYPCTSAYQTSESHQKYAKGYLLEANTLQWMFSQYLNSELERSNGIFAPLEHKDLSDMPQTLMILAENDLLVDEGNQYAIELRKNGNDVKVIEYQGLIHDFARFGNLIPDEVNRLCNDINKFIHSK